ncbi:MAG: hypothetical protein WCB53_18185 [Terriglobales bacterium]
MLILTHSRRLMRSHRRLIAVGASVALVASAGGALIYERLQAGIVEAVSHKSARSTTGTVVSVSRSAAPKTSSGPDTDSEQLFRVCFTLDDLSQIERGMRAGFEAGEARRLAKDGPRCMTVYKPGLAAELHNGDKIGITCLLENEYQISIVRMRTPGGEDVDFR